MKKSFGLFACFILLVVTLSNNSCQRGPGDMRLTDDSTQYIKYTIAGNAQNFLSASDSFRTVRQNTSTVISAHPMIFTDSASWQYTSFNFSGIAAPGTYTLSPGTFIVTKGIYPQSTFQYNDNGPITITITEFGNTGEYIKGEFTASLRAWTNSAVVAASCEFRVKRTF